MSPGVGGRQSEGVWQGGEDYASVKKERRSLQSNAEREMGRCPSGHSEVAFQGDDLPVIWA